MEEADKNFDDLVLFIISNINKLVTEKTVLFFTNADVVALVKEINKCDGDLAKCRTCQKFLKNFFNTAVVIDGVLIPLICPDIDTWNAKKGTSLYDSYNGFVQLIVSCFKTATITDQFIPSSTNIGTEKSGGFNHFYFKVPTQIVNKKTKSEQSPKELHDMLKRVFSDNTQKIIYFVTDLFAKDKLPFSDRFKLPLQWLSDLSSTLATKSPEQQDNIIWLEAINSPTGFIHALRNSIGTVFENVRNGEDYETIKKKWCEIAGPSNYMRPQKDPHEGTVKVAQRLCEELGIKENDFRRCFVSEIPEKLYLWKSVTDAKVNQDWDLCTDFQEKQGSNLFSHLPTRQNKNDTASLISMKELIDMLPYILQIYLFVPAEFIFYTFITGYPNTFPLMHWHNIDNLVSWYTYQTAVSAASVNLTKNTWVSVTNIVPFPHMWEKADAYKQFGTQYLLNIKGCYDKNHSTAGSGLFPTMMKSEFHGIRSVIESFSNHAKIEGIENAHFSGLGICKEMSNLCGGPHKIRVITNTGARKIYLLDRMD